MRSGTNQTMPGFRRLLSVSGLMGMVVLFVILFLLATHLKSVVIKTVALDLWFVIETFVGIFAGFILIYSAWTGRSPYGYSNDR